MADHRNFYFLISSVLYIAKCHQIHGNYSKLQAILIQHEIGILLYTHLQEWVVPEKIHTSPTDGILEILAGGGGGGGKRLWKSRREGGLNFKKSSAGVISTDNSSASNV